MNNVLRITAFFIAAGIGTFTHAQRSEPVDNLLQRCVNIETIVRDTSAKGYYDKVVVATNKCGQTYLYKVCKVGTPHCTQISAKPGTSRVTMETGKDDSPIEVDTEFLR